jgi:hypothetical protein
MNPDFSLSDWMKNWETLKVPTSPGSGWAESRGQLLIVSYGRAAAVPVPA